jgi:hypothetical protein
MRTIPISIQIAVLNKINATGVTSARIAKDANYLSCPPEQQLPEPPIAEKRPHGH